MHSERHRIGGHALRQRVGWSPNDSGRMRGKIEDALGKLRQELCLNLGTLTLKMTGVIRVGEGSRSEGARKLALVPSDDDPVGIYLKAAYTQIRALIEPHIPVPKQERNNLDNTPYTPKLTIGRIHKVVDSARVDKAIAAIEGLVNPDNPLTLLLGDVKIFDHENRRVGNF